MVVVVVVVIVVEVVGVEVGVEVRGVVSRSSSRCFNGSCCSSGSTSTKTSSSR